MAGEQGGGCAGCPPPWGEPEASGLVLGGRMGDTGAGAGGSWETSGLMPGRA